MSNESWSVRRYVVADDIMTDYDVAMTNVNRRVQSEAEARCVLVEMLADEMSEWLSDPDHARALDRAVDYSQAIASVLMGRNTVRIGSGEEERRLYFGMLKN